ncbi:MAG: DUF502 domain-containing protein [Planctomycetota bacterium]
MKRLARFFLDGLLAVLPLAVTIYVLVWLFRTLESVLGQALQWALPEDLYIPGMGIALGVVVIFMVGLLLRVWLIRKLVGVIDAVFDRVPLVKSIYSAVKDLTRLFRGGGADHGKRVVMVDMPGDAGSLIGFVTRDQFGDVPDGIGEDGQVAVYLPMSYQLGGYMLVVARDRVRTVDMPVEDALRFALTAGAGEKDDATKVDESSAVNDTGDETADNT